MPSPYIESPADEFHYEDDFKEEIADTSPALIHMSNDIQEATLVGLVLSNKLRACVRWFLGFSYADESDPWLLHRENPQYHPLYPQLRAYDVTVQDFVPLSNEEDEDGFPRKESPFVLGLYTANYKWMRVTIRYRNFMYRFREDSGIPEPEQEWKRNVWVQTEPRVEALTVSGGQSQLVFCESSDAAGATPAGPPIPSDGGAPRTPFPAPIAFLLSKKGIVINWYDVPWFYLSSHNTIFTPDKLDAIVGRVNLDTFMDIFPPGTLLAEPYRYSISTWAIAPEDANDPLRKVTLAIPFSFFDPEPAATRPAGAPFTRGHNLMPWGGNGVGASMGGNGKFYLATRDGTTTGPRLLESAEFTPIFTHVFYNV